MKAIYVAPEPPRRAAATAPRHEALRRLVAQGVLSVSQANAVQEALGLESGEVAAPRRVPWAEIVGYLGGGLLLTGAVVLVATSWDDLTRPTRTILVSLFAVLLLAAGTVAAGGVSGLATARHRVPTPRLRLAGALWALGAGATAFAVGVGLSGRPESETTAVASGVGLLVAAAGYALVPTGLGLIGSVVLGMVTVASSLDAVAVASSLNIGLGWFGFGLLIGGLSLGNVLGQPRLGLGLGAAVGLAGAQLPLGDDGIAVWAYLLTMALGVGCLALYRWVRTPVLLVFGVIGVTLAVPEAIWDATNGAVGGAAVLLIAGAVLLAASGYGFGLHRRHRRPAAADVAPD